MRITRVGPRLSVSEQVQFGQTRNRASHPMRGRLLAIEIADLSGRIRRAADIFTEGKLDLNTVPLSVKDVDVSVYTPLGHAIKIEKLAGMTPAEIDSYAVKIDEVMALAASRAFEIPIPEIIRMEPGSFPVKGSELYGDQKLSVLNVTITKPFGVGKHEVTVAEFRAFVKDEKYEITGQGADELIALLADPTKDMHPVVFVNRTEDAPAYTRWLSEKTGRKFRLLTAAEREYVARGSEGRIHPWGDEWKSANLNSNSNSTTPVNAYPEGRTREGVEDLAGNVWEWTSTQYGKYAADDIVDPKGPESGNAEIRGGSAWDDYQRNFRGAFRYGYHPEARSNNVGFRVAEDL